MAVAVVQEFETTQDDYDSVAKKLDIENNPPEGMLVHTVGELGDGKWRAFDVFESEDAFNKFREGTLGPAVVEVVGEDAPAPKIEIYELRDLFKS